ncbi:GrpB family protein [Paenibacillus montanisoli]|uniref:GrpB family protein n=2 Tax=Paenibacillus montanisoli TaxID=2081970 RepID=A0A328U9H4_9BACL|nr:GrpB family protein [Paenibacillus montanisoli]
MKDPIVMVPYDAGWAQEFRDIALWLRQALGDVAQRIDHIGSTSVPGLAAKPVIDIQVSVRSLEPVDVYLSGFEQLGYVFRADNTERTKRYFREGQGMGRTHIHVREAGSFGEQFALLFRDYLRWNRTDADYYAGVKTRLMEQCKHDRQRYVDEKEPYIWEIMRRASRWSQETGWKPEPTDM